MSEEIKKENTQAQNYETSELEKQKKKKKICKIVGQVIFWGLLAYLLIILVDIFMVNGLNLPPVFAQRVNGEVGKLTWNGLGYKIVAVPKDATSSAIEAIKIFFGSFDVYSLGR